ncbi:hypothetical protein [Arthrobacter zhaoguopingii]|uniref:hypothetical protein n=1 Tax=Arthrobacter zhaoguopingii TaxID=2681491 RepID=UPI00135B1CB6
MKGTHLSPQVNRRLVLAARPHGNPKGSNFRIEDGRAPVPAQGQVPVRKTLVSLDPSNGMVYSSGRCNGRVFWFEQ